MHDAIYCIIDMKRVNEIDSTGANIILQIKKRVEADKKFLLLSHIKENRFLWGFLGAMDVAERLNSKRIFPDTDTALEWCEDHLLKHLNAIEETSPEFNLSLVDLLRDFTPDELEMFKQNLVRQTFKKNERIFKEGDESRDLYFLKNGSITVQVHLPETNRYQRLVTFAPEVVFGEMAFLDGKPRSADVYAHEDSEVLCLVYGDFRKLENEKPNIATKLIRNIALELSSRLRITSHQVRLLEDS